MNNKLFGGLATIIAAPAMAQVPTLLISADFTDLSGSFTVTGDGTGTLDAFAAQATAGTVTRVTEPLGQANFDAGFNGSDIANVTLSLNVVVGNSSVPDGDATGGGTVTFTDANGDTISAFITGDFFDLGGFISFEGLLTNVVVTSSDGSFDGTSSGSFSTDFDTFISPFSGSIVLLQFDPLVLNPQVSFFGDDFRFSDLQIGAQITGLIPAPGALALLGLGGLAAAGRRRA